MFQYLSGWKHFWGKRSNEAQLRLTVDKDRHKLTGDPFTFKPALTHKDYLSKLLHWKSDKLPNGTISNQKNKENKMPKKVVKKKLKGNMTSIF